MRVLLVNPYQDTPAFVTPNLGLGYLAGSLLAAGHEVAYLDCPRERCGLDGWRTRLAAEAVDLIGVQLFTFNLRNVATMLRVAREIRPDAVTVCGGPHATAAPRETLASLAALDFLVHGEGERALCELLAALADGSGPERLAAVDNLAWRDGASIRVNRRRYVDDLDSLPDVAWNLMPPESFPDMPHGVLNKSSPIAPIQTSRGCPFPCAFCSAGAQMGRRVRTRSARAVIDEIELLVRRHGVREIHIEDDNFTFDRDFALAVCEGIIRRGVRVAWACPNGVRLDRLDAELLRTMEASGCYSFAVGVESGSDRVLRRMRKGLARDEVLRRLRLVRDTTRIKVTGFFVVGYPGETREDLAATERLILEAPLDRVSVSPFMPLPGTRAVDELVASGKIPADADWAALASYRDEDYVSFCELSAAELLRRARRISLRFYLRPRVIGSVLSRIHSVSQVKVMARYLVYLLSGRTARYW